MDLVETVLEEAKNRGLTIDGPSVTRVGGNITPTIQQVWDISNGDYLIELVEQVQTDAAPEDFNREMLAGSTLTRIKQQEMYVIKRVEKKVGDNRNVYYARRWGEVFNPEVVLYDPPGKIKKELEFKSEKSEEELIKSAREALKKYFGWFLRLILLFFYSFSVWYHITWAMK